MKPKARPLPMEIQTTKVRRNQSPYRIRKMREFKREGMYPKERVDLPILTIGGGCVILLPLFQFTVKKES
jgi:hypothetical protein